MYRKLFLGLLAAAAMALVGGSAKQAEAGPPHLRGGFGLHHPHHGFGVGPRPHHLRRPPLPHHFYSPHFRYRSYRRPLPGYGVRPYCPPRYRGGSYFGGPGFSLRIGF
jgi:hypothetical protein